MRRAIYAGSFDPITFGHLNVIGKAMNLFDELIIAIGDNPNKTCVFTHQQRKDALEKTLLLYNEDILDCKVTVDIYKSTYLIDYAKKKEATHIIRGIRNASDYENENNIFIFNKNRCSDIETIFIMPDEKYRYMSSSSAKNNVGYIGWRDTIKDIVPPPVFKLMIEKYFTDRFKDTVNKIEKMYECKYDFEKAVIYLLSGYDIEKRPYHNINHIIDMLQLLDNTYIDTDEHRTCLEYAIFFHDFLDEADMGTDAIYKSAVAALSYLPDRTNGYSKMIEGLITTTDYSIRFSKSNDKAYTRWQKLMMDMDFAGMGKSYEHYSKNTENIRKEYSKYTEDEWIEGRKKFIKNLLHYQIFTAKEFECLENNAKENLRKELSEYE